jgi:hypothetical protein
MVQTSKMYIVSVLLLLFFSCGKKIKKNDDMEEDTTNNQTVQFVEAESRIEFPDTVFINEPYNGNVLYQGVFDTIITEFADKEKYRYVIFRSLKTDNINYDVEYLSTIVKDTFGAVTNRIIPLRNIVFDKTGVFYIDGIIEDTVIIDLHQKNEKGEDLEQWRVQEFRATKKVVVIDKE